MTDKTIQQLQPLDLDKISQKKLEALYGGGYIARKWGALPCMPLNEYWTLTVNGEQLFYLV
jgi:hypothetical protein